MTHRPTRNLQSVAQRIFQVVKMSNDVTIAIFPVRLVYAVNGLTPAAFKSTNKKMNVYALWFSVTFTTLCIGTFPVFMYYVRENYANYLLILSYIISLLGNTYYRFNFATGNVKDKSISEYMNYADQLFKEMEIDVHRAQSDIFTLALIILLFVYTMARATENFHFHHLLENIHIMGLFRYWFSYVAVASTKLTYFLITIYSIRIYIYHFENKLKTSQIIYIYL